MSVVSGWKTRPCSCGCGELHTPDRFIPLSKPSYAKGHKRKAQTAREDARHAELEADAARWELLEAGEWVPEVEVALHAAKLAHEIAHEGGSDPKDPKVSGVGWKELCDVAEKSPRRRRENGLRVGPPREYGDPREGMLAPAWEKVEAPQDFADRWNGSGRLRLDLRQLPAGRPASPVVPLPVAAPRLAVAA